MLLLIFLTVTACGGGIARNESEDKNRLVLLKEAEFYIRMAALGKEDEAKSSSENIRKNAEGEDKERFLELADLMDQGDLEKIRSVYAELGGEYIDPNTSSDVDKNEENDKFAALSLEAAQLYVEAETAISLENRYDIAKLIESNSFLLSQEDQAQFEELAGKIKDDNKDEAASLYYSLKEKFGL
ncbi:hypothetical protein CHH67_19035 [Paenibacillus campinasensis]|uniref:Uncharacterized protein n=1 Tax=Paenibacillus campinasensis TaxID=66347 RepID=A0A268ELE5_9BACL|nr:hypothetical protein CHH67_19035 [Paenibacillus campinasensis]